MRKEASRVMKKSSKSHMMTIPRQSLLLYGLAKDLYPVDMVWYSASFGYSVLSPFQYFRITMIQTQVSLVILFNFARWGSRSDFRLPPFNPSLHKYDCQAISIVGYTFIPIPGRLESHQYRTIVKRIAAFYTFLLYQQFRCKWIADQK